MNHHYKMDNNNYYEKYLYSSQKESYIIDSFLK